MSGYVVTATIHGPAGWFDVVDESHGTTIAVCPQLKIARRVAALLTEHEGCRVEPAPVLRRTREGLESRS